MHRKTSSVYSCLGRYRKDLAPLSLVVFLTLLLAGCGETEKTQELSNEAGVNSDQKASVSSTRSPSDVLTINAVRWERDKGRLKVKITGKAGDEVALSFVSGQLEEIDSVSLSESGAYEFKVRDITDAPCRVRIDRKGDGMSVELDVEDKPDTCI